jgi:hypothetical protein
MNARQLALALALAGIGAGRASAQDVRCTDPSQGVVYQDAFGQTRGGDACQKGVDLFNYLTPQLGHMIAGGNATLGQTGPLGRLGKVSFGLRVNALEGGIPRVDAEAARPSTGEPQQSTYPVKTRPLPLPQLEGAIGVFGGIPLGLTSVGSVDALVSAFYLPNVDASQVSLRTSGGGLRLGYGVRVGILGESLVVPGVSFTWARRSLPKADIIAEPAEGDTVMLGGFDNETSAWRIVAGKRLGLVGLAAGYGRDSYRSSASMTYSVDGDCGVVACRVTSSSPMDYRRDSKASTVFADLTLNLLLVKIVGEVGQTKLSNVHASDFYNQFEQAPDKTRLFASVGFRIGLP